MLSYHDFRESPRGRTIVELAGSALREMEALSARGEPAVAAIDGAVADALGMLDAVERQHGGRIVRDELASRGLRPKAIRKRLRHGRAFVSGSVYGPVAHAADQEGAKALVPHAGAARTLARADEAVALLARSRIGSAGSVDDFIAERRIEAHREEA